MKRKMLFGTEELAFWNRETGWFLPPDWRLYLLPEIFLIKNGYEKIRDFTFFSRQAHFMIKISSYYRLHTKEKENPVYEEKESSCLMYGYRIEHSNDHRLQRDRDCVKRSINREHCGDHRGKCRRIGNRGYDGR